MRTMAGTVWSVVLLPLWTFVMAIVAAMGVAAAASVAGAAGAFGPFAMAIVLRHGYSCGGLFILASA